MPRPPVLRRLRVEIARDLESAERLMLDLEQHAPDVPATTDPVVLAFIAITLHQTYTAIEAALERICRELEGDLPRGSDAHQALLRDMALTIPGVRPAILDEETVVLLRPLLRFRHFVRHAYAVTWNPKRLGEVVAAAAIAVPRVRADMDAFSRFLEDAAAASEE